MGIEHGHVLHGAGRMPMPPPSCPLQPSLWPSPCKLSHPPKGRAAAAVDCRLVVCQLHEFVDCAVHK